MHIQAIGLIVLIGLIFANGDTPANCLYDDIVGSWTFSEGDRLSDPSVTCDTLDAVVYTKQFVLKYPNAATDEMGNSGTWTMIYNQGFEVNINGRSYFAFSYYEGDFGNSTSFCDRTATGWSRDKTIRNWSCFYGQKDTPVPPRNYQSPYPSLPDQKYKVDNEQISRINSIQDSWRAKAYPDFERYTLEEMVLRQGGRASRMPVTPSPSLATQELKDRVSLLPENFDWRNINGKNYISPVRDQENCGSCYIFCSTAAIEARLRIVTKNARQDILSTQDVVSCSRLSQGCAGGFNYLVARYAQDQGVVEESCNVYTASDDACNTDQSCTRTYVEDYSYLGGYFGACNEELMMEALVTNGPLAVAYQVYDDFRNYVSGIYHHTEAKSSFNPLEPVNHGVLLVGYGVEDTTGEPYWICKNSWGADWGEQGFFRIRRGNNECGIESMAVDIKPIP